MKSAIRLTVGAIAGVAVSATAFAQEREPMSAAQLEQCAQQVQALRAESARLNAAAAEQDAERDALAEQRAAVGESREAAQRYNERATAFNERMARFRDDLAEINATRDAYAQQCAERPYRRADLEAMPAPLRNAMRQGLADVRVPNAGPR